MATSELLAFSFVVLLAVFTLGTGLLSLTKGKVYLVPGSVTKKERFGFWIAAVFVQVFTGVVLGGFCLHLYQVLTAPK
ncbi:MAG: hypothetical protein JWO82_3384 [Akkermansiaceae bacterium]|jgi:hypothetical protein|nr:hypothetical protein [Akkermansiaceae bacterium]